MPWYIAGRSMGPDVDTIPSRLHLQTSAKHQKTKGLTLDVIWLCSHVGMIHNVPTGLLDPGVDAYNWKCDLQTSVKSTRGGNAYQGPYKPIHLLPCDAGNPSWSTPIRCLQYGFQSLMKNLQNVSHNDDKSIASSMHLSANTSISVQRDLPNWVTTPQSLKCSHQKPRTLEQWTTFIWNH